MILISSIVAPITQTIICMPFNYYSCELWLIVCIIPLGVGEEASGRGVGAIEIGPANRFRTCKINP